MRDGFAFLSGVKELTCSQGRRQGHRGSLARLFTSSERKAPVVDIHCDFLPGIVFAVEERNCGRVESLSSEGLQAGQWLPTRMLPLM